MQLRGRVGRADLRQRVEHRRKHPLIAVLQQRRQRRLRALARRGRRASSPAPRAPTSARRDRAPEIEPMNVSTSSLRQRASAAARTDGHCADTRSISSSAARRIAQLRQRGDRFELQVLIDPRRGDQPAHRGAAARRRRARASAAHRLDAHGERLAARLRRPSTSGAGGPLILRRAEAARGKRARQLARRR